MAIQDEMYKAIEQEIDQILQTKKVKVDLDKVKKTAKILTALSVGSDDADNLINQYIAQLRNLCKN